MLNSKEASELSQTEEYISFRSTVSQKKVIVDEEPDKVWTLYDAGPQNISCPLICLPPVSGTADVFYKQIMPLSARGYRVISVQYPVYWTMKEWVNGFQRLLDYLNLDKVHIFGASLGGFLAQKYAELSHHSQRVQSIILCNSFCDTTIFNYTDSAVLFWMTPSLILKRMIISNLGGMGLLDSRIADSVDFIVERLESLSQPELASRLTLNCINSYIQPHKLHGIPITIMDVFDKSALNPSVRESVYKNYPDGKRAHLKAGGNFPFLSRSEEVNMHIQVHLRQFQNTRYQACDFIPEEASPSCSNAAKEEFQSNEMNIFERSL